MKWGGVVRNKPGPQISEIPQERIPDRLHPGQDGQDGHGEAELGENARPAGSRGRPTGSEEMEVIHKRFSSFSIIEFPAKHGKYAKIEGAMSGREECWLRPAGERHGQGVAAVAQSADRG